MSPMSCGSTARATIGALSARVVANNAAATSRFIASSPSRRLYSGSAEPAISIWLGDPADDAELAPRPTMRPAVGEGVGRVTHGAVAHGGELAPRPPPP